MLYSLPQKQKPVLWCIFLVTKLISTQRLFSDGKTVYVPPVTVLKVCNYLLQEAKFVQRLMLRGCMKHVLFPPEVLPWPVMVNKILHIQSQYSVDQARKMVWQKWGECPGAIKWGVSAIKCPGDRASLWVKQQARRLGQNPLQNLN